MNENEDYFTLRKLLCFREWKLCRAEEIRSKMETRLILGMSFIFVKTVTKSFELVIGCHLETIIISQSNQCLYIEKFNKFKTFPSDVV